MISSMVHPLFLTGIYDRGEFYFKISVFLSL
jgi:hypothetical protein